MREYPLSVPTKVEVTGSIIRRPNPVLASLSFSGYSVHILDITDRIIYW
ncbi:hypothetical protein BVRB_2g024560 isoform A [Beta vulgaris subsp. vulgaris]|nr:hypothetical protein BVRB_2g024560 isoform A [Beta vulgaris subsp. vulgaris]